MNVRETHQGLAEKLPDSKYDVYSNDYGNTGSYSGNAAKSSAAGFFQRKMDGLWQLAFLIDLSIILVCAFVTHYVKTGSFSLTSADTIFLLMVLLIKSVISINSGLYQHWPGQSLWLEIRSLALSWAIVILMLSLIAFMTKTGAMVSRIWAFSTISLALALMIASRVAIRMLLNVLHQRGRHIMNAVIFGAGENGALLANRLAEANWAGVKVVGFLDDNPSKHAKSHCGLPILGGMKELKRFFERNEGVDKTKNTGLGSIDMVWIALPISAAERIQDILDALKNTPAQIHYMPDFLGMRLMSQSFDNIAGIPVANLSSSPIIGVNSFMKSAFDKVFSLLAIIALSPLMLLIAILIKSESKGSVLFKQRRYGAEGREIEIWKFRTMTCCEDSSRNIVQATVDDARVTRVGKYLRAWSLDELPQFFNVLQGTMSVVGPRPHAIAHNELYKKQISNYMQRHMVKPGITGWAQVHGLRGETSTTEKMAERVKYDLEYIRKWSFSLDLYIVLLTIRHGIFSKNAY